MTKAASATASRGRRRSRLESHPDAQTGQSRRLTIRRAAAFAIGLAVPSWLALEGGGFDVLVRQRASLVLWWALAVGLVSGFLPRARWGRSLLVPAIGFAGLVAWTALSFAWTDSDEATYLELARVVGYAGVVCAAWACLNQFTFRAAIAGISVAALGVSALALLSRLAPSGFPVDELAVALDVDRLSYPFGYWNAVAAWGCASIAIGLIWSAHARSSAVRAAALAAVPAAGLAVYFTYSRAGVGGAALALLAVAVLSRNRWTAVANSAVAIAATGVLILIARGQPAIADATGGEGGALVAAAVLAAGLACAAAAFVTQRAGFDRLRLELPRWVPATAAVAAFAVLLGGAAAAQGPLSDGWDDFLHEDTTAETARGTERLTTLGGDRDDLWGSAVDAFAENPFTGLGPGTFEFWWAREGREQAPVSDAHSLYLETLAELGLPGLALLLVALGGLAGAALYARGDTRGRSDYGAVGAAVAALAVFAFHAGVDWMWETPALAVLALGGVAAASTANLRRARGRSLRRWGRAAAVAVALVAGAVQIPGIVGTERTRDGEEALAAGDPAAARELATSAADAQPWAASPLSLRALAEEELGELDDARADLLDAREREPSNWRWAAQLARIEELRGDERAAARAAAAARSLNRISSQGAPSPPGA